MTVRDRRAEAERLVRVCRDNARRAHPRPLPVPSTDWQLEVLAAAAQSVASQAAGEIEWATPDGTLGLRAHVDWMNGNQRRYGSGRGAVRIAKRFLPHVMSQYGLTVHRTAYVLVDFRYDPATLHAGYVCAAWPGAVEGSTTHPAFYGEPPDLAKRCAKCYRPRR